MNLEKAMQLGQRRIILNDGIKEWIKIQARLCTLYPSEKEVLKELFGEEKPDGISWKEFYNSNIDLVESLDVATTSLPAEIKDFKSEKEIEERINWLENQLTRLYEMQKELKGN